jgi:hypothetical protein
MLLLRLMSSVPTAGRGSLTGEDLACAPAPAAAPAALGTGLLLLLLPHPFAALPLLLLLLPCCGGPLLERLLLLLPGCNVLRDVRNMRYSGVKS